METVLIRLLEHDSHLAIVQSNDIRRHSTADSWAVDAVKDVVRLRKLSLFPARDNRRYAMWRMGMNICRRLLCRGDLLTVFLVSVL